MITHVVKVNGRVWAKLYDTADDQRYHAALEGLPGVTVEPVIDCPCCGAAVEVVTEVDSTPRYRALET